MSATCHGCGTTLPPSKGPRAKKWCSERCRKAQYAGACIDCGGATDGSNGRGPNASVRCRACELDRVLIWTPEAIICAVREWADEHGGVPPTAIDWGHPYATDAQRAEFATGRWPWHTIVRRRFGSWNKGLIAAGFEPHLVLNRLPDVDEIVRLLQAGESTRAIAERYGVGREAVYMRLHNQGLRVSEVRRAAA